MTRSLTIESERLGPIGLQALTLDLVSSINRNTDARAEMPESEARAGERGDPVTLGTIVLSFISSGTAVALFQVLKSYFERDESLEMSFERPGGHRLTIRAENMSAERIDESIALARAFFSDAGLASDEPAGT